MSIEDKDRDEDEVKVEEGEAEVLVDIGDEPKDKRLSEESQAESVDEKRARRREEKQEQKRYRREKDEELKELRARVKDFDSRMANIEVGQIHNQSNEAARALDAWKDHRKNLLAMKKTALDESRSGDVIAIDEKLAEARDRVSYLENEVDRTQAEAKKPRQPAEKSDRQISLVAEFRAAHSWFKGDGTGTYDRIVLALDQAVRNEGYDPETPDYFEEVERRMKADGRIPANLLDDDGPVPKPAAKASATPPVRRGPPVGDGGGRDLKPTERLIPRELRDWMKESGIWDDKDRRKRVINDHFERKAAKS